MWGENTRNQRGKGYVWLKENLGYDIHFHSSSEKDIRKAHDLLFKRMIKYGFEYFDDKSVKIAPPQKESKKEKKVRKEIVKSTKINFKPQIAENAWELQRNHKTTIQRKKTFWQKIKSFL